MKIEEAIKELKERYELGKADYMGDIPEYVEALGMAITALEEQSRRRWISINDKLPDTDDYILLSFANFTGMMIGRYEVDEQGGGAFYMGDDDEPLTHYDLYVNAWQPLPEPYREEQTDDKYI